MTPRNREHLAGHIVVWLAHVSQAPDGAASLEPCLDVRDRERAARFRFVEDRARFVLGRGLLRKCLSQYLQRDVATIQLSYTDRDRPILADDKSVHFSISHTHNLVALAVTSDARVGIDLEYVQPYPDLNELAERILSADDLRTFLALARPKAQDAFFRVWTRKEAYLKARGEGISEGLQQISVSMAAEEVGAVVDTREESAGEKWQLFDLAVPAGYRGCLACDDERKNLQFSRVRVDKGEVVPDLGSG